jgi:hypothetical protein
LSFIKDTTAATGSRAKAYDVSNLLTTGVVAGLAAGLAFILADMINATSGGKPAIAPFLAIGTIFFFDDKPMMTLEYALTGVITHLSLSIVFGVIFALVLVPLFSNARALLIGGIMYGGVVYVVNFQILGRILFEFFDPSTPEGPPPLFNLWAHLGFGLLLVPFFLTTVYRYGKAPAAHAAADRVEQRTSATPEGRPGGYGRDALAP